MEKKQTLNCENITTNVLDPNKCNGCAKKETCTIINQEEEDKQEMLPPPGFGTKDFIPPQRESESEQERQRRIIELQGAQEELDVEPLLLPGVKEEEEKE